MVEEEKARLLAELEQKNENQQKEKTKQQKLLKKIKNMEEKILEGDKNMDKALRQEQKLIKATSELEQRRRDQAQLQQELVRTEMDKGKLKQNFTNKKEELEAKNSQID